VKLAVTSYFKQVSAVGYLNVLLQHMFMGNAVCCVTVKAYLCFVVQTDLFIVYFCRS